MKFRSICGMFAFALAVTLVVADSAEAQRGRDRGGWGRMMGGGSSMGLLNSEKVQQELEITEDQKDELQQIRDDSMQAMRDMFSEMQDVPREERREKMREMQESFQEKMEEFTKRADQVLLPHQRDRLKQIGYQSRGRGRGAGSALGNEEFLDELGLSAEEKEKVQEAREKAQEELQKKYAKLVAEAEEDILKVLPSDKRKKYREMVGEPFQFEERGRGRDRGDRGGRDRGRDRGGRDRSDF